MSLLRTSSALHFGTKILQPLNDYMEEKKEHYRYRIGDIRFIYRVDRGTRLIRILQIDNRGDIY